MAILPFSRIQERQFSVTDKSMFKSTGKPFRGLSLPRNSVSKIADHTQHDPNGLTGP